MSNLPMPRRGRVALTVTASAVAAVLLVPPAAAGIARPAPAPAAATTAAAPVAAPVTRAAATAARAPKPASTSALERRRVDRVPTPKLRWAACTAGAECATVRLPLDYDQPKGATTQLALVRVKARDPKRRIGSLFVNPGGPGAAATELALDAPGFLSDDVLDRFDVVGVDPRGVGDSADLRCFRTTPQRDTALAPLDRWFFPYGRAQENSYVKAAKALGRACSTSGRTLAGAMSTSEAARDMDVLRRAVGDKKLTYLGFSYGSTLGQYYANLFPDRVRAVAVDGVVDAAAWAGSRSTRETIQDDRLRSADGAYKALREILVRCDKVGAARCAFAAGDPVANFALLTRRLQARPVVVEDELGQSVEITYATFVAVVLGALYGDRGYRDVTELAAELLLATEPPAAASRAKADAAARRAADMIAARTAPSAGRDLPYDDSAETKAGVACTDGQHPADSALWPAKLAAADRRAPYFGRAWGYATIACGRSTWTVRDEDAYAGPWTKRTSGPVLVVGNYWDPATNYADAVTVSKRLPNSRLLSSDSWGHTAYGRTVCVTGSVDRFLLTRALPRAGTVCRDGVQPFASPSAGSRSRVTGQVAPDEGQDGPPKPPPPIPNPWLRG